ncbi:hypothetical protein AAE478_007910 [Parahypoxylon ruwenzoriense]
MATPQNKGTVLVTGGSGYVGGQIIREALEAGYNVRITARSQPSAEQTVARYPAYASRLSTVVVPDITDASAYASAFADGSVVGVIHAASPFVLAPEDNVRDLLEPAVRGATSILDAAHRFGGGKVARVVSTSSFAAIVDLPKGKRPGYTYSESDWNPVTWDEAAAADGVTAYCASKALAERAMWKWFEDRRQAGEKVGFALSTICPPWVFGPYAHELASTRRGLSESVQLLDGIIDSGPEDEVPAFDFGGYADSREVAAAHVAALTAPEAAGRRFLVGQPFRYQAAVDAARELVPRLAARLPRGKPGEWEEAYGVDGGEAARVLGVTYGTLARTVGDTYVQLLRAREMEKAREVEVDG